MPAPISRLHPLPGSLSRGLAAFRAASLRSCLSELSGVASIAAATLRSRALLRLGDPKEALAALAAETPSRNRDRAEVALLRAVSLSRIGDVNASEAAFLDAHVYAISSADAAVEAEVAFYAAHMAFGENRLSEAREACYRGLETAVEPRIAQLASPSPGVVPVEHVVARAQELLGLIEAAEGKYLNWLPLARMTLNTLDQCAIPDIFQSGFAIANLAILARDFDLPDDAHDVALRVDSLPWTEDVSQPRFRALYSLAWCSALRGDNIAALGLFRRAATAASTVPERIYVAVSRSVLARELGNREIAAEEVQHALTIGDHYDWDHAAGDYRNCLLDLAQAASLVTPARAREVFDRYRKIRTAMHPGYVARIEARVRAEEAYTEGVVLRAEARLDASTERLQVAFGTWESIGYHWRAARAALELAELNAGDVFRLAVRRELVLRPDSLFSARARLVA